MFRILDKNYNYSDIIIYLLFIYIGTVYFSFAISNIIFLLCSLIFVYGAFFKKVELHFLKRNWLIYGFVTSVFSLTLISTLFSENIAVGFKYLWLRAPIIIVPFILVFMETKFKSIKSGLVIFLTLSTIAALITVYKAFIYRNEGVLFEPDFVFFITIIQHPYFGVFILIALISIMEFNLVKVKQLKVGIIVLFTIAIALTTSRLVYVLYIIFIIFYLFKKFSKKKVISLGILLSLIVVTLIIFNTSIVKKFQSSISYENSPRLKLWDNSLKLVKSSENEVLGIGIGDYYQNKQDVYFFRISDKGKKGYNPHSQVVEFYITNGVIGILILLLCIVLGVKEISKQNNFALMLFSIIILFSFTECILSRQFGVQLYSVFIPLAFNHNFKKLKR